MKRIRVAHIITRMCKGGAQENTFHTCRLMNRERYEVDLIAGPVPPGEICMEGAVRDAGVELIPISSLCRTPHPLRDWRAYRSLARLIRQRQYHIVHTHTSKAGILGRFAARTVGTPIIIHTPHGHIFTGYFSDLTTRFFVAWERRAAAFTDTMIALTERGIEEHLERRIGVREKWTAIFSGIDLSPYERARARRPLTRKALGVRDDEVLIGAVGRLEPVKGFSYVVDAAREVLEHHGEARFVLVGDGSLRGALADLARPLGDRFHLLGQRDDIPDLMAAFDVFVLPSLNEGMGRVLLEAGAAGVPSVATAVGGVPDVVVDGVTGLLTAPRDARALAHGLRSLIRDRDLRERMGAASRTRIDPYYGLDRMVRGIEDVYERLLKEKGIDA
ncbi:MAG: hypothetical protein AMXMBFR84_08860 [Candidatus Hydrogenedentota bacterium]